MRDRWADEALFDWIKWANRREAFRNLGADAYPLDAAVTALEHLAEALRRGGDQDTVPTTKR